MSFDIVKTVDFPQATFQYVPQEILGGNAIEEFATLGGILSDLKHLWHAKGPCLEVRNTASGRKVGSWTFGGILKDSSTKIIGVDELKRPHGRLSLLVVALECTINGGLVCIFDVLCSKVLRVVQVGEQITSLHVIDSGCENSVLPEPSALRYFDGIVAVGTLGGNVYLLDICRQICENAIHNMDSIIRDELNPCPMIILNKEEIANIKKFVQQSVDKEEHLAVNLNAALNQSTKHFTLKGEKGEDRVHVNRSETEVSCLFYSSQLASCLVGYNFGAFQLWDLRSLQLVYTSPICEGNIPVMHFTVQEPADDPKAYYYIWVSYSHNLMFHTGLPFAVMYSFYYDNKNYINGYGNLYENFQHCSVRFQLELGETETPTYSSRIKGGTCIGLQSLNKYPVNKELNSVSLCLISWLTWNNQKEVSTSVVVFDLNQWYKEQMPRAPNWTDCSNYMIKHSLNIQVLDVKLDQKFLKQFIGIQRLEEHFCPTSLSFDLLCLTDNNILKVHNKGLQQAFIDKIVEDQHLSLVRPEDYFEQITSLGLVPLLCEIPLSNSMDTDFQRETLLNVALEQKLIGWLCKCTTRLANNAFNASGLTIYNILNWAFERAITLKNACDKYCIPLFDYSGIRLDNNTVALLNSCTCQIRNICSLYRYISSKLMHFISDKDALLEEQRSLENVVVYFEVLLWMVNIGLLPECLQKKYQSVDDSFTSAPYLVNDLTQYYNRKRAQLQMASHDTFVEKDCLLFVDNLINVTGGAEILRQQWQEDGGSGLYPPPSLQSVLRTYLLDGPDLVFKHCLVTYTLLDIAMTVDENNKVIKLLLKFPQIFDLSQSNIKIVQAFWHLDHDDYETALEYILNPCVLTEDLQRWHHSVMMRSLLLQDQSSLALLYLQIRKPSLQDEKDLLTVISLLISKNMLNEAFKFRQQHQNPNEQTLLLHIFNECNKNEQLHSLLYRRLNNNEEKSFFNYLQSTKSPKCEDLKVFYYLLRSRFLEAFDSYSAIKRKKPENQGLIGQRDATSADNIVKLFKNLLPEVNKNLVDLVRKERTNLWKEVSRPTPLSVFVHNAGDQVQYKSSVIFAALAKAKQTFNDTGNDSRINNDVVTEETPFLRTPTVFRNGASVGTPLIKSKVIEQNEQGEEYGPSPCKKLKLSPRTSKTSPVKSRNISIQSKLSTPIIRRKRLSMEMSHSTTMQPQSILKSSSTSRTILDDSILDENTSANTSLQLECENSVRRSRLALTPRKPVNRTPVKSHVKFEDLRYSNSSTEPSNKYESTLNPAPDTSRSQSVDSTASTSEDIFYSPDSSPEASIDDNQKIKTVEEKLKKSLSPVTEKLNFDETLTANDVAMEEQPKKEVIATKVPVEDNDLSTNRLTFQSPRSRRSYKRSFGDSPVPVRSSPRLAKKTSQEEKEDSTASEISTNKSETLIKPSPSVAVQKLRGRRSLSRAVLEHNTFSKLESSNIFDKSSFGNKSGLSSLSSTTNDSDSEMDSEQSHNNSLEELLAKYRTSGLGGNRTFNTNDDFLSDSGKNMDLFKDEEVVSKTTEVQSIETYKDSIRKTNTQELVSSKESMEEYHSQKVEVMEQDELKELSNENPDDHNIFTETTQDMNVNYGKNIETTIEDDKKSEAENSDVSNTQEFLNHGKNDEDREENEEINVYEDLSSGSEDIKEVLKQFEKKVDENIYADISFSTSASYYQSRRDDKHMPEHFMESNSNDDTSKSPQPEQVYDDDIYMEELYDDIPASEKAFVESGDVIEIGSSSDEDNNQKENKQETDESSQSSSSSSSEEKSYSSRDESNDNYEVRVEFESNLNETSNQKEKVGERSSSDENIIQGNDLQGKQANSEERETKDNSDEALNQETREIANKTHDDLQESSESSLGDDRLAQVEQQFELDQKEIEAAVKILQADSVVEEQSAVMADDEYMDSLILEEQSPEKEIKEEIGPKTAQLEEQDDNQRSGIDKIQNRKNDLNETDKTKESEVNDPQIYEEKALSKADSSVLTADSTSEPNKIPKHPVVSEGEAEPLDAAEKDARNFTQKQSRSLQCTLGVNDTLMSSYAEDNTSAFEKLDEDMVLDKNQVPLEKETKNTDVTAKEISESPQKESKDIQCTLGVNDSLLECSMANISVFLKDNENKDQLSPESNNIDMDLTEKETLPASKQSKSLQCTLGINDSLIDSSIDNTYVFLKNNENKDQVMSEDLTKTRTTVSVEKHSTSLQGTPEDNDVVMQDSKEEDIPVPLMEDSPKSEEETPVVLKHVKKTYIGRKTSGTTDLDATPKLVVSLTRRTYSRKDSGMGSKLMDSTSNVESGQVETRKVSDAKHNIEDTKNDAQDVSKNVLSDKQKSEETKNDSQDDKLKSKERNDEGKKKFNEEKPAELIETKEKKSVVKEIPDSTSNQLDSEKSLAKTKKDVEETIESTPEKDNFKLKNKETAKSTPSMPMTRRRSMLLSQEETPSSTPEKSAISSSIDRTSSKGTEGKSGDNALLSSTSQTTESPTPSSRRVTRSQLSESLFEETFATESPSIRAEVDIMETSLIGRGIDVRVERDVLKSDEKMEGKKPPEAKPGPSKIRSGRSSKSISQRHVPYAIFPVQPKKRTRSASVDQASTIIRKRSVRSKSIDLDDMKGPASSDSKLDLRVMLTPIEEQPGPEVPEVEVSKPSTKAYSDVGAYTTSRRLTRRQASMLKSIGAVEKEIKKLSRVEEIDPLRLLDKEEFKGKPDPDESKVYEQVSPSNSSGTLSRHTRSASVLSDVLDTPKRKSKVKNEHVDSSISGIKTRLRKQSTDTMSVASDQSDSPSPSKKVKKKEDENDSQSVKTAKRGRSRGSSVSSTKSAASDNTESSVRTTRSRRIHSAKSELPEIEEEKDSNEDEIMETSVIKKRGRKKKN